MRRVWPVKGEEDRYVVTRELKVVVGTPPSYSNLELVEAGWRSVLEKVIEVSHDSYVRGAYHFRGPKINDQPLELGGEVIWPAGESVYFTMDVELVVPFADLNQDELDSLGVKR